MSGPRSPRSYPGVSQPTGAPPFKVQKSDGDAIFFAPDGTPLWPTSPLTPLDRSTSFTSESSSEAASQQIRGPPSRLGGGYAPSSSVTSPPYEPLCSSYDASDLPTSSPADALLVARTSSEIEHWLLEDEPPVALPAPAPCSATQLDPALAGWTSQPQPSPVSTLAPVDEGMVLEPFVEKDPWAPVSVSLPATSGMHLSTWELSPVVSSPFHKSPASSAPSSPELDLPSFSFIPPGMPRDPDLLSSGMNWGGLSSCAQCGKPGSLSARCLGCAQESVACLECAAGREARGFEPGTYCCAACLKRPVREMPKEQLEKLYEQFSRGREALKQSSRSAPVSPRGDAMYPLSPNIQPFQPTHSWDDMCLGPVPNLSLQFPGLSSGMAGSSSPAPSPPPWKRKHAKWRGKHT